MKQRIFQTLSLATLLSCIETRHISYQLDLRPENPTTQDFLECGIYRKTDQRDVPSYVLHAPENYFLFEWKINEEEIYREESHGWSVLEASLTKQGDNITCYVEDIGSQEVMIE